MEAIAHVQRWVKLSISARGVTLFAPSSAPATMCSAKVFGTEQAFDTPLWHARHFVVATEGGGGAADTSEGLITVVVKRKDPQLGDITVTVGEWISEPQSEDDASDSSARCIGLGGAEGHIAIARMLIAAICRMHTGSVQKLMDAVIRPSFIAPTKDAIRRGLILDARYPADVRLLSSAAVDASREALGLGADADDEWQRDLLGGNACVQKAAAPKLAFAAAPAAFVTTEALPISPLFTAVITAADRKHHGRIAAEWAERIDTAKKAGRSAPEIKKMKESAAHAATVFHDRAEASNDLQQHWQKIASAKPSPADTKLTLARALGGRLAGSRAAVVQLMEAVQKSVAAAVASFIPASQRSGGNSGGGDGGDEKTGPAIDVEDVLWFTAVFHTNGGDAAGAGGSLLAATEGFFTNTTHVERLLVASFALCTSPSDTTGRLEVPMKLHAARLAFQSEPQRAPLVGTLLVFFLHSNIRLAVMMPAKPVGGRPEALQSFTANPGAFAERFVALMRKAMAEEAAMLHSGVRSHHRDATASATVDDVALMRVGDATTILADGSMMIPVNRAAAGVTPQLTPGETPRSESSADDAAGQYLIAADHPALRASRRRVVVDLEAVEEQEARQVGEPGGGGGLFACCTTAAVDEDTSSSKSASAQRRGLAAAREEELQRRSAADGTLPMRELPARIVAVVERLGRLVDPLVEALGTLATQQLLQLTLTFRAPNPNPIAYGAGDASCGDDDDNGDDAVTRKAVERTDPRAALRDAVLSGVEGSFVKFIVEISRTPPTTRAQEMDRAAACVREHLSTHVLHSMTVYDPQHGDAGAQRVAALASALETGDLPKVPLDVALGDLDAPVMREPADFCGVNVTDGGNVRSASLEVHHKSGATLFGDVQVTREPAQSAPSAGNATLAAFPVLGLCSHDIDAATLAATGGVERVNTTTSMTVFVAQGSRCATNGSDSDSGSDDDRHCVGDDSGGESAAETRRALVAACEELQLPLLRSCVAVCLAQKHVAAPEQDPVV